MRRSLVVGACVLGLAALAIAGTAAIRASSQEQSATHSPAPAAEPGSAPSAAPAGETAGDPAVSPEQARPGQPVEVDMRNVDLRLTGGIVVHVYALRGRFRPTQTAHAPFLDDNDSYSLQIDGGRMAMSMGSLNTLLNQRVLGKERSNVKKVEASVDEGQIKQKGVMHKGIDLPFKTKSEMSATDDGRIRVHTKSVKMGFLPVKPIMKLFSIEMDDMVKIKPGHGAVVQDNDILLSPGQMLPPPRMDGKLRRVWLEGNNVMQDFGPVSPLAPAAIGKNHIYWRGGDLRFGKLTMDGTDLELIDLDPDDPFDFSVDHWNDMLVGGFSKNTPEGGLKTYMPDYGDLKARKPRS
jgi:hypothetical protein